MTASAATEIEISFVPRRFATKVALAELLADPKGIVPAAPRVTELPL